MDPVPAELRQERLDKAAVDKVVVDTAAEVVVAGTLLDLDLGTVLQDTVPSSTVADSLADLLVYLVPCWSLRLLKQQPPKVIDVQYGQHHT